MRQTFKYRLEPNKSQQLALAAQLETCRRIYNDALAERKEAWEKEKRSVSFGQQYKKFATLRNAQIANRKAGREGSQWYANLAAVAMRDTLKRLDKAFQNFFRRVKEGAAQKGYPRFRSRDRYDSIPFDNYNGGCVLLGTNQENILGDMPDNARLKGCRLRVFGVGPVKIRLHRPIKGKIKTVTIKREADKWYVFFSCDLGEVKVEQSRNPAVGVDVGLEHFLTTSEGEHEPNPRYLKGELPELRRQQRTASQRFQRGKKRFEQSGRYRQAQQRVRKLHVKVKNQRKEYHHQTALKLVRWYGVIAVESLNIRGMVRNGRLSRAIGDAAWGGFLKTLRMKCESHGVGFIEVDPAYTSQTCSVCGYCQAENRPTQAKFLCLSCGHKQNADHNAARVILARALGLARTGPAGAKTAHESVSCPENL